MHDGERGKVEPKKYYDIDKVMCDVGIALTILSKYLAEMGGWLTNEANVIRGRDGASVQLKIEFSTPHLREYLMQHGFSVAYVEKG